ncbi:MAG: hypothetical protein NZ524_06510 [Thiobacillaceae bacterium]|nr:hypothetical protein [Thiobacillaceae bacterium]MDW8323422.1 hypothetical protein [Burkholderiales bacterium]
MNAPYSREHLGAFVDGELDAGERERLLARLQQDPAVRAEVCELLAVKAMVKACYQDLASPRAPTHAARRGRGWAQALAAGVLFAGGLGLGWLMNEGQHRPPPSLQVDGLPAGFQAVAATPRPDVRSLILHVDSGERAVLERALALAESLLAQDGRRRVEVVVHSAGLDLLRADVTPFRARIERLARMHANLSFVACGNTIARLTREGKRVVLLPQARKVDSAVGNIVQRLRQGWVYIKV